MKIRGNRYDLYRDKEGELWWIEKYDRYKVSKVKSISKFYYDTWGGLLLRHSDFEYAVCAGDVFMGDMLHRVQYSGPEETFRVGPRTFHPGSNGISSFQHYKLVQRHDI